MIGKSYNEWLAMSDDALAELIGQFIRHHRLEQNTTQDEVAAAAGISRSTLSLLERGEPVTLSTLIRVLRVLNQLQLMEVFVVRQQVSPLALAKAEREQRNRARKPNAPSSSKW